MTVYFIGAMDGEEIKAVKIGHTGSHIHQRVIQLQIGSYLPLRVLAMFPGMVKLERQLHRCLDGDHIRGEWYRPSPEIMGIIRGEICEIGGEKSERLSFGSRGDEAKYQQLLEWSNKLIEIENRERTPYFVKRTSTYNSDADLASASVSVRLSETAH